MSQTHHISAGFVIFRLNKGKIEYLLLYNSKGHWDFPKGHVEKEENLLQAAKRETEEEAGIRELEIIPLFHETIKYWYKEEGKKVTKEVHFFLAKVKEDVEVRISWEHQGYKWVSYEEAMKLIKFPEQKKVLQRAHEHIIKTYKNEKG